MQSYSFWIRTLCFLMHMLFLRPHCIFDWKVNIWFQIIKSKRKKNFSFPTSRNYDIRNSANLMHWQITTPPGPPVSISHLWPNIRHFWEIVNHEISPRVEWVIKYFWPISGQGTTWVLTYHLFPLNVASYAIKGFFTKKSMWRHMQLCIVSIFRAWWTSQGWCWNFPLWCVPIMLKIVCSARKRRANIHNMFQFMDA